MLDLVTGMPPMPNALCRADRSPDMWKLFDRAAESIVAAREAQKICRTCDHLIECQLWLRNTPRAERPAGVVGGLIVGQVPDCAPTPVRQAPTRPKSTPQPALRKRSKPNGKRKASRAELELRRSAVADKATAMARSTGSESPGQTNSAPPSTEQRRRISKAQRARQLADADAKRAARKAAREARQGVTV